MNISELLWELTGTPISKQKRKYKRCRKRFLAIRLCNGAVQFYGSYGVRCSLPIDQCVKCRHYVNVNVLVPKLDVERKGLKEAVLDMAGMTWGNARKLFEKYVLSDVDRIVRMLEKDGEVRLL